MDRLQVKAARLLGGYINFPRLHTTTRSYELLPTSSASNSDTAAMMKRASPRRYLLLVSLLLLILISGVSAGLISRSSSSVGYPRLLDATIDDLAAGLARKKFTSVDLVKAYLDRISEAQNVVHAVTEINPDALRIAARLDAERSKGRVRGPLHGIPLLIKNNIATKDKMNNTAGSYALLGAKVPSDSTVAQKLREAGAIILGKTSLSEWANFRSFNAANGWSALGGQVYGPYFPKQDPWGSSSGSGVAAALGLATGCLGTETDGSISRVASFNNIVGIKPTVGLTSRYMVIPVSEHQDSVGPLARTVKDAAYMLQSIAGKDMYDNYTSAIPDIPDYIKACKMSGLKGVRIGVPRNVIPLKLDQNNKPELVVFEKALKVLREAGATIVENTNFTAANEYWNSTVEERVLEADFVVNLQSYLDSLIYNPNEIISLAVLRNFTQSFPLEEYPERNTGVWDSALTNWNNTDPRFWPVYQQQLYYGDEGGLLGALKRNHLDAVVLPTNFAAATFAAIIGAPVVTVPLGFYPLDTPIVKDAWGLVDQAPNIPFGISFMGAKFTEEKLIGMAYAYEQRTKVRTEVQPYIAPSTEISTRE